MLTITSSFDAVKPLVLPAVGTCHVDSVRLDEGHVFDMAAAGVGVITVAGEAAVSRAWIAPIDITGTTYATEQDPKLRPMSRRDSRPWKPPS